MYLSVSICEDCFCSGHQAKNMNLGVLYHHLFELVRTRRIGSLVTDVVSHVLFLKVEFIT